MVCYKPYSTHKQVYTHAQRLDLQGLHNAASTIAHSHCLAFTCNSLHTAKRTHRGRVFKQGVVVDSLGLKYRHIFKNGQQKKFSAKRPSKNGQEKAKRPTQKSCGQPTWNAAEFQKFDRKTAILATLALRDCTTMAVTSQWQLAGSQHLKARYMAVLLHCGAGGWSADLCIEWKLSRCLGLFLTVNRWRSSVRMLTNQSVVPMQGVWSAFS